VGGWLRQEGVIVGFNIAGFSIAGLGLNWDTTTSDKKIAQDVLDVLDDRRVLNPQRGNRPQTEASYCMDSAQECRALLTEAIKAAKVGSGLRQHLKDLRDPFTNFVEEGGPDGIKFSENHPAFQDALNVLRRAVIVHAAVISKIRGVTCPDSLRA
jgi:hypothetical protein